jgi:ribosome biogenesis protein Nip4
MKLLLLRMMRMRGRIVMELRRRMMKRRRMVGRMLMMMGLEAGGGKENWRRFPTHTKLFVHSSIAMEIAVIADNDGDEDARRR